MNQYFAPLFFVVFVLMAQFVLVNVVVAVLMKHLEESHKQVCQMAVAEVRRFLLYRIWRNDRMGCMVSSSAPLLQHARPGLSGSPGQVRGPLPGAVLQAVRPHHQREDVQGPRQGHDKEGTAGEGGADPQD